MDKNKTKATTKTVAVKKDTGSKRSASKKDTKPRSKSKAAAPDGPKKNISAYLHFNAAMRKQVEDGGFKGKEIMAELGRLWKATTPKERTKYEEMAVKDKERFNREHEAKPSKSRSASKDKKSTTKRSMAENKGKKATDAKDMGKDKKKKSTAKKEDVEESD